MPSEYTPAQFSENYPGQKKEYDPTIWVSVSELPAETPSDMKVQIVIPDKLKQDGTPMTLEPGKYVAFVSWKGTNNKGEPWLAWTGPLKRDTYEKGGKTDAPPPPPPPKGKVSPDDIPF